MRLNKKSTTNLIAVMNYSQAFGQAPPKCPFDLLRQYPTDLILLRISKINAILYLQEDMVIQNMRVLKEAIFDGLSATKDITIQLSALLGRSQQGAFSGPVMSLIIKEALENYVPAVSEVTLNAPLFAGDLFKAILAYNEHFYDSSQKPELETFAGLFGLDIQQQYYLRRESYLKLNTLLKFAFISKFLSEDEKLKGPALEYCRALQIGTVWGLAKFLLHIFQLVLTGGKEARHILDRNGANWPVLEQFVIRKEDLLSERPLSLHKEIVPKPFYEIDADRLLILDNNYFTFGLDQGVLYSIFMKTSLRELRIFKSFDTYKGYFGLQYFEQYYVGRFIKNIFSKWNNRVVSTDKYQDYIVKAGNNVFVFEIKMNDFNANGLDKESFSDFKEFIDTKFLQFKQGSKSKAKGLAQIIRQIGYLAQDHELMELLDISGPKKIIIHPIIVYSDANLDMNGVNEYVNEKVPEHLVQFAGQFQSVRPLVMINGSFFMTYYYLLRKDPAIFGKWLSAYLKSVNSQKKHYHEEKGPLQYMLYNKSFAEHMRRKIPKEDFGLNLNVLTADFDLEVKDFGKDFA